MTVNDHTNGESAPEWKVRPVPGGLHDIAEKQNSDFQYVFDQIDLMRRDDPEGFSKELNAYKPLWRLPKPAYQRILNHFIRPVLIAQERSTLEEKEQDRYQEELEDTAGFPPYEARAIARGEPMAIPRPGLLHRPPVTSHIEAGDESDSDLFRLGTKANKSFIEAELARGLSDIEPIDPEIDRDVDTEKIERPGPIKFGIESDDRITHTRRERRTANKLQEDGYTVGGALKYLNVVSHFGNRTPQERVDVMKKSINHMFDYEADARASIASLGSLLKKISKYEGSGEAALGEQDFMKNPGSKITRALELVTYYREALNAENDSRRRIKDDIETRVRQGILLDSVDNAQSIAAELYFREEERQKFWDLQLRGRPADRDSGIQRRFGAIDIVNTVHDPELAEIIYTRLNDSSDLVD